MKLVLTLLNLNFAFILVAIFQLINDFVTSVFQGKKREKAYHAKARASKKEKIGSRFKIKVPKGHIKELVLDTEFTPETYYKNNRKVF